LSIYEQLEPKENDDDHNEDYDKPTDEYETGDTVITQDYDAFENYDIPGKLEKVAIKHFIGNPDKLEYAIQCIDHYRIHGHFPEGTDPQIYKDLATLEKSIKPHNTPSTYPTFEVSVNGDRVEANAVPIGLNLKYNSNLGPSSTKAKNFIKALRNRNMILNDLAYYILEMIQGEFFRQKDFDTALRFLLPVSIKELSRVPINSLFKIDKKYLSKLGDHIVSCSLGSFPLNLFQQNKPQIVRFWVKFAIENEKFNKNEQLDWIRNQIENIIDKIDVNDIRLGFASQLKDITIDDIKYAYRIQNQGFNNKTGSIEGLVSN
jgi:hypothetical protein